MENDQRTIEPAKLKRELKVADAAAFSVGLIGPVGVMALLGAGVASMLGGGATWAFIIALIAVALVAFGFVKLSRHIAHTCSVYATVGLTLGPRAGFIAGWGLLLGYVTLRALFALARDSGTQTPLTCLSEHGSPTVALAMVAVLAFLVILIEWLTKAAVLDATFWALTIGTIAVLVAYVFATFGAIRFLFVGKEDSTPKWQVVVPTSVSLSWFTPCTGTRSVSMRLAAGFRTWS